MKTYTLNVFGINYKIKTDRDDEYVSEVARMVDEKMHKINELYPQGSLARTAVLAAINLADELISTRQTYEKQLNQKIGSLIEKLVKVL
ncbi:MAG: cell division protein ZapA [candidate division WOR-3 bacterium]|nr:cell division protein ZapA [candidate division WOR-3 bacterium]MCX7757827.1 cell division protein ZapA [candidate division WOR-3 bacterium]MDW7988322.1 cell division protein ZapA [candidate division WOR-3 bacterium]